MKDKLFRILSIDEKNQLHMMIEDTGAQYRAKIIVLKDEGHTVPKLRKITDHHDVNKRKWIHRFHEKGIEGTISKNHIKNNTNLLMIWGKNC
jgi:hypothetical protein